MNPFTYVQDWLDENADYAPIQDSNYTATGWSNSRYKGTKIWSTDFNI